MGDLLIGLAMKIYRDDDPVKLSLAFWIKATFSDLHLKLQVMGKRQ